MGEAEEECSLLGCRNRYKIVQQPAPKSPPSLSLHTQSHIDCVASPRMSHMFFYLSTLYVFLKLF